MQNYAGCSENRERTEKKKNKQTKASSLRVKTKRKRNVRGNSFNTKAALD